MINTILNITPFDIDNMATEFIANNSSVLRVMCNKHLGPNDLAFASFKKEVEPVLKNACISFVNNNYPIEQLKPYLIAVVMNFFTKERGVIKAQSKYVCPGCRYLKQETYIKYNKIFKCEVCAGKFETATDAKEIELFKTFATHHKKGYKCRDCERFIPQPLIFSDEIVCPYYDCFFVGKTNVLKEMRHPIAQVKVNIISLDTNIKSSSNVIASDTQIEMQETFKLQLWALKEVIQSQINLLYYNGTDSTLMHKLCMYQAFMNLIDRYPEDMISYLILFTHNGGMQHRLFREYVNVLESKIPFSFKKNKKMYRITSLLDDHLNVFDGISIFDAIVTDRKSIKNLTTEFYIGGRKGTYSQPYYIGKLLDIVDLGKSLSILNDVKDYSFSKIKLDKTPAETHVRVSHLRIPPHYQMGSMVYLNRIRKKIVDKVATTLDKKN